MGRVSTALRVRVREREQEVAGGETERDTGEKIRKMVISESWT